MRLCRVSWGKRLSLSLSSVSVVRASSAKEDNLGTLLGFAAVLGSFGEASLSSIPVVCASSTNEGNFRGIYALDRRTPSIQEPTMEQYHTVLGASPCGGCAWHGCGQTTLEPADMKVKNTPDSTRMSPNPTR